jgi:uncharacterized membrane protein YkvA (DUF1232 family)
VGEGHLAGPSVTIFSDWKAKARRLKADTRALCLALGDARVPWYAKALAVIVVAYAVCPIDLIPDFIPVLGLLDDLIIIPAGMYLVFRLVPAEVMDECRAREARTAPGLMGWTAAAVIVLLWAGVIAAVVLAVVR